MSKEDIIIDMMDTGRKLNASDLTTIENDEELGDMFKDILTASSTIKASREKVDVEERLAMFKKKHENRQEVDSLKEESLDEEGQTSKAKILKFFGIGLSIAAMIALAVFMYHPAKDKSLLYEAELSAQNIEMESESGETFTLPSKDDKTTSRTTVIDAKKIPESVTLTIPYGKDAVVNLADGSKVHLHPGSKLHFPNKFVGNERVVTLEGEAYFEVTHNPAKPFIVKTESGMMTKVLGTEFDFTAYADKPASVTLVKGKVEVVSASRKTMLTPGKQAILQADGEMAVNEVDTEPFTLWRDGYLFYDNVPMDEILEDIGKYYNMSVKCLNPNIHAYRLRFMVKRDETIQETIDALNMMQKVKVSLKNENIIIVE